MTKYVNINLFSITSSDNSTKLSQTIEDYSLITDLSLRWRGEIRLDEIKAQSNDNGDSIYFLGFSKEREIGPGKLKKDTVIEGISLEKDYSFGEETAALYIPKKQWLLVLHNQSGIGPTRMMSYFNQIDNGATYLDYLATPFLSPKVDQQLKSMKGLTVVEFDATTDYLSSLNIDDSISVNSSLSDKSVKRVKIILMANEAGTKKKVRKFLSDSYRSLVNLLKQADDKDVSRLIVKGPDPEADNKDLVLNLLEHQIKERRSANDLVIENNRYTVESKWKLLERCYVEWNKKL